jgi:hypothetical protein
MAFILAPERVKNGLPTAPKDVKSFKSKIKSQHKATKTRRNQRILNIYGTMHLASPHKATAWFLLISPSPLEGEGRDEGENSCAKAPLTLPSPSRGEGAFKY